MEKKGKWQMANGKSSEDDSEEWAAGKKNGKSLP